jgi:predicted  nucleic acid-binding Zn-ribbon protein
VKAAPADQLRLLDVQAIDINLDQLAHRRQTLPELADIARLEGAMAELRAGVVRVRTEVEDLDREIRRLETDIEQVRSRSTRDTQRMESGAISSSKELEKLQHEVVSLARRQNELEESELELMESREEAEARLSAAQAALDEATAALGDAEKRRDAAFIEIDTAIADKRAAREPLVAALPSDLLAFYEKLRTTHGGVGAAMLRARRCEGCHLELAGGDLAVARSAAEDEVLRCEECRRILIRTAESGL